MSHNRPGRRARGAASWPGTNHMYQISQKLNGSSMRHETGDKLTRQEPQEPEGPEGHRQREEQSTSRSRVVHAWR